jgi:hypothetical protein
VTTEQELKLVGGTVVEDDATGTLAAGGVVAALVGEGATGTVVALGAVVAPADLAEEEPHAPSSTAAKAATAIPTGPRCCGTPTLS